MSIEIPVARRETIATRLADGRSVSANSLAVEFAVSEDAIRRDLRALAAEGLCRRVYGGALPLGPATLPLTTRIAHETPGKRPLASFAARSVRPGEILFLDGGSTNLLVVEHLPEDGELTVVTNSMPIAAALLRRQDVRLITIGGEVDPVVGGCVDAAAVAQMERMTFDRCFLGACAVSAAGGISVHGFAEATFKRALLARSRTSSLLTTTDKLGTVARHRVTGLDGVAAIVVEHDAPDEDVALLAGAGARVQRAVDPGRRAA